MESTNDYKFYLVLGLVACVVGFFVLPGAQILCAVMGALMLFGILGFGTIDDQIDESYDDDNTGAVIAWLGLGALLAFVMLGLFVLIVALWMSGR